MDEEEKREAEKEEKQEEEKEAEEKGERTLSRLEKIEGGKEKPKRRP